jgi:arsenite methyltransferase
MKRGVQAREHVDYGIDAPYVIRNLAAGGLICLVLALSSHALRWLFSPTISLLATAGIWLYCSRAGKLVLRDKLMNSLSWNGNETVLDVGCGSGLLLIAAAKRLNNGRAVGVDIWRAADLSNNRPETTLRNARIEGVAERIKIENGDVRELPFADAAFDVVVSLNVLHNIDKRGEREKALEEIVRVLKPEGRLLISDFRNTGEYVRTLRQIGMKGVHRKLMAGPFFPIYAVIGSKSVDSRTEPVSAGS